MSQKVPTSSQDALNMAAANAPWKAGTLWWVVLIQGIVLVVMGAVIIFDPASAANVISIVGSLYLLINGILRAITIIRHKESKKATPIALIRVGVGIAIGALVLLGLLVGNMETRTAAAIFAFGIVIEGILALVQLFFFRDPGEKLRFARAIPGVILLLAGLLIFAMKDNASLISTLGTLLLIAGLAIFVLAITRYNALKKAASESAAESPAPAAPPAASDAPAPAASAPAASPVSSAPAPATPPPAAAPAAIPATPPAEPEAPPPAAPSEIPPNG